MSNIKILHYYTTGNGYAEYAKLTQKNREAYCLKHGYELVVDSKDYGRDITDSKYLHNNKWKSIQNNFKNCDYLVWIDCDILIMNGDIALEDLIVADKSIICAKYNHETSTREARNIHNGIIILKNDKVAHAYIDMACMQTVYHASCLYFKSTYVLDEDISQYIYDSTFIKNFFHFLEFDFVYSNSPIVTAEYSMLRSFLPGDYILHLSYPLSQKLKQWYIEKYITMCEKLKVPYIMPLEVISRPEVLKELAL